jgi:uncharacterized protein (TIGR00106 family)
MNKNVIVQVTIAPLGTASTSLSQYVADVEKVLAKHKNVKTQLTPMSTIMEGSLDDIMMAIREMHETPFLNGAQRVSTRISIDDRRDKVATMDGKLKAIQEKLEK